MVSRVISIVGHVNEHPIPTMHYFGIPRHIQSMIANMILMKSNSENSSENCKHGNMPYRLKDTPYDLIATKLADYFAQVTEFYH